MTTVLRRLPWLLAFVLLVILVATVPAFRNTRFLLSLPREYFAIAALALALTPVMLTGGIDLSVASTTVLASVVVGLLWRDAGWSLGMAMLAGGGTGLLCGLVNGGLVCLGILPLVATLATRELFRGLATTLSQATPIPVSSPEWFAFWARPWPAVAALIVLGILSYVVVHHTWVGRMLFALGDNEQAARFAAVPVKPIQLGLYAWSGLVAGACGGGLVLQYNAATASAEKSLDLLAIACVVMGGVRVTGGAGHVAGAALGVVTVCGLLAGLGDVAADWRDTVTGAVLIAVALAGEAAARWVERVQGSNR